jgi:hypothetical protein
MRSLEVAEVILSSSPRNRRGSRYFHGVVDSRLRGCVTISKQPSTGLHHSGLDPESSFFSKYYNTGCRIGVRHDRMQKSPFCHYDTVSCAGVTV